MSDIKSTDDIVNPFDKDHPKDIPEAIEMIDNLRTRVEGLEEVIRQNDKSFLRMKRDFHKAKWEYHGLHMETIDKELG